MSYITSVFDTSENIIDYDISNGQLLTGDGLPTLFLIALFTANISTPATDVWWGSTYSTYPVGSKLPLLVRGVKSGNGSILLQAKDYATDALQPFLSVGVISSLNVTTQWTNTNGSNFIQINITVTVPGNDSPQLIRYGLANDGTAFVIV